MDDEITIEFARRDDCLDRIVPSDLRQIVSERDRLRTALEQAERERQRVESTWKSKALEHKQRADTAERQRDEARGLLREAKGWCPQPESVGQAGAFTPRQRTSLRDRINAHLRDTGD